MQLPFVSPFITASALAALLTACGGSAAGPGPVNLGGGLWLTADGAIPDTAAAAAAAPPIDFLFASAADWQRLAQEGQLEASMARAAPTAPR